MFTTEEIKIVTLSGKSVAVQFGSRGTQANWDDDDDYDCACCIGGFSK